MSHNLMLREVRFRLAHGSSTVKAPSGAKILDVRFHLDSWVVVTLLVSDVVEKNKEVGFKFLVIVPSYPVEAVRMPTVKRAWKVEHKRYPNGVVIIHYV